MAETERGNVVRGCDVCGQSDDHPRHIVVDSIVNPRDPGKFIDIGSTRHMDCCAAAGCEHDGSCAIIMAHVAVHGVKSKFVKGEERLRGDDLRAHIVKHGDDLRALHEQAAYDRLAAEHGQERLDRYLAGGPLYLEDEAAALRAAGVRTHRELQQGAGQ